MSSNKFSNPWMPASNGVFGGGGAYNKNTYSVRGRGAANNPWVQQSAWWENIVEGNYQKGFGQASHSNEYYSTEPVSLQAMRRMRTITVLVAGGAILGAAAAAGLFFGGGGAAAAGGAAATTAGGGGAALGSGGLFAGGGLAGTGITTAQALTTAGSVVGGVVGNSLLSSQGASAGQGSSQMGNVGNSGPGGNTPMNALNNPLTPGWPPTQPSGNPQPNQQTRNRRRRREESDGENMDTSDYDYWEQQYQEMTRNTMRGYGMSYGGNGTYAKTTGRNGYGNNGPNKGRQDGKTNQQKSKEEYQQNTFEYKDPVEVGRNDIPWQSPDRFASTIKLKDLINSISQPLIHPGGQAISIGNNTLIVSSMTSKELFNFMLDHYKQKTGNVVHLNQSILNNLFQSAIDSNAIIWEKRQNIGNNKIQVQINFYKTDYALIFGTATMILELNPNNSRLEPVGFIDTFNFDPKLFTGNDQRNSPFGEVLTRIGTMFSGKAFEIVFP